MYKNEVSTYFLRRLRVEVEEGLDDPCGRLRGAYSGRIGSPAMTESIKQLFVDARNRYSIRIGNPRLLVLLM